MDILQDARLPVSQLGSQFPAELASSHRQLTLTPTNARADLRRTRSRGAAMPDLPRLATSAKVSFASNAIVLANVATRN